MANHIQFVFKPRQCYHNSLKQPSIETNNNEDKEHSRVRRAADDCPAGFYKKDGGCALCSMGFSCAGLQADPVPCSYGQYSGMGASSCSRCDQLTTQGKILKFILQ